MTVKLAREKFYAEQLNTDYVLVIEAVEAAKPLVDRIGRFREDGTDTSDCDCNTCTEDKAARAAFASIDFTS